MKVNIAELAKLANIQIEKNEVRFLENQLSKILKYVGKLNEVNTTNIEETHQINDLKNITKEDIVKNSLSQKDTISTSKKIKNGFFVVESVFEQI